MIQLYCQEWEAGPILDFYKIEDNQILASATIRVNQEEEETQLIVSGVFSYVKNQGHGTEIMNEVIACYLRNHLSIEKDSNLYLQVRKRTWMIDWYKKLGFKYHSDSEPINGYEFIWMKYETLSKN